MNGVGNTQQQIPALTGLRFVAAFSVALGHTIPPTTELLGLQLHGITAVGMPLFFTLSGFIIHYTYSDDFASRWRSAVGGFAFARFSRIYPLYLALLLFMLFTSPMGVRLAKLESLPILCAYLLGVITWLPIAIDGKLLAEWYYGISWSVSTELFFYVCYAAFLYRIALIRDLRWAVLGLVLTIVLAVLAVYLVSLTKDQWEPWVASVYPALPVRTQDFQNSFYRWLLYFSPYGQLPGFICGALTCQVCLLLRQARWTERVHPNLLACGAVLGIILVWMEFQWLGSNGQWLRGTSVADLFVTLHMNMLLVPLCCLLILALTAGKTMVGALLSTPFALFLGEISYSTYLSHPLAQGLAARIFGRVPESARLLLTLLVIVALSAVLFRLVELPAKRSLRRAILAVRRPGARPADQRTDASPSPLFVMDCPASADATKTHGMAQSPGSGALVKEDALLRLTTEPSSHSGRLTPGSACLARRSQSLATPPQACSEVTCQPRK